MCRCCDRLAWCSPGCLALSSAFRVHDPHARTFTAQSNARESRCCAWVAVVHVWLTLSTAAAAVCSTQICKICYSFQRTRARRSREDLLRAPTTVALQPVVASRGDPSSPPWNNRTVFVSERATHS
ncbi:unnamed protein product, partial [Ectocarpus fasciculatus]